MSTNSLPIARLLCSALLLVIGTPTAAQGFTAAVSPPRFEFSADPGSRSRQVIEIVNPSPVPARFRVRTADWSLGADASVTFHETLQSGSCRPWVAIERTELTIGAGARVRYRFEVAPPADTAPTECRFAILIEGDEPAVARGSGLDIPVRGRIGVIAYVAVGAVAPQLEVVGSRVVTVGEQLTPALVVRNTGTAHGRLEGFLSGVDARGRNLEFAPSSFPVLPGETRVLQLTPQADGAQRRETVTLAFPVTVRGTLEWKGGRQPFEHRFETSGAADPGKR